MMVPFSFSKAPLTLSPKVARRFWRTAGRGRLKRPWRRVGVVVDLFVCRCGILIVWMGWFGLCKCNYAW